MRVISHEERGGTGMPGLLWLSRPGVLLRMEGAALLAVSVVLYWVSGGSWLWFALLLFVPDVSMLGYAAGPQAGAAVYNAFHAYPLPAVLGAFGLLVGSPVALGGALIWFSHIGMDRLVGYGLKYPTESGETHLGRL
jgi:hypothetical protein